MSFAKQEVLLDAVALTDAASHDSQSLVPHLSRLLSRHPDLKGIVTRVLDDGAADDPTLKSEIKTTFHIELLAPINPRRRGPIRDDCGGSFAVAGPRLSAAFKTLWQGDGASHGDRADSQVNEVRPRRRPFDKARHVVVSSAIGQDAAGDARVVSPRRLSDSFAHRIQVRFSPAGVSCCANSSIHSPFSFPNGSPTPLFHPQRRNPPPCFSCSEQPVIIYA